MANKPVRDWVYLAVIGLQLTGMLVLDLVAFYPPPLWMPPGAPLHFLVGLRRRYVTFTGDPFFSSSSAVHGAPWFEVFLYIEGLVQFPLAAYLVSKLASPRRMAGPAELAGLAFGCLTFMGSAACCYELLHMGADQVAAEKKTQLLYGTYLPFVVIPAVLAVDMFLRLLPRVQATSTKDKDE
ncbi:hypothetical protein LEL_06215 [Akanthomyces lecanii RCEF 1005]|uniref:EXPERA domain-containing protein n=1 Tax=Akanthomyces lecanii RCEF 1005 TaxID=1081108 RepID=A0A168GIK3_CORDF|nr:hypothetical protein LEL_06215 [Akanthomyces lecanii RCEF 1005]